MGCVRHGGRVDRVRVGCEEPAVIGKLLLTEEHALLDLERKLESGTNQLSLKGSPLTRDLLLRLVGAALDNNTEKRTVRGVTVELTSLKGRRR